MPLSAEVVGTPMPDASLLLERGRLRLFCEAIGETSPVYLDVAAARAAGHPDLPVPPTFLAAIQHEVPQPLRWIEELGADPRRVLHGEQAFTYHRMVHAGQTVTLRGSVTGHTVKKGGAMELLTRSFVVTDETGGTVAELEDVVVVRGTEADR
ncbi:MULTISPECIES: MaoC family dehydratase N-terminal domain-containing protein [unclassified Nocardiopsis]|uniref:FAS1-like dehydratase domain-containing protein n=1 Tax=unclassified Nocardiopsis TaxID=2649073 RepID=UPI00340545C5